MRHKLRRYSLLSLSIAISFSALAEDENRLHKEFVSYSQSDLGGVGLMQVPTARMMKEGEFVLGYRDNEEYRFWTASLQLFDWMEATIRYADFRDVLYSSDPNFSGDQSSKDKGIDTKFRLVQESMYIPQISLGIRDFGGTGSFESEYLMASKQISDFDIHLGLGWGYLGNAGSLANPFCEISDSYCTRDQFGVPGIDQGGQLEVQDFFNGTRMSVIGGIEYQSPWEPLRFTVEFDGNHYRNERFASLPQDSRWNFGVNYRYKDLDLSLTWLRGNTLGFGLNYNFNFHEAKQYKITPEKTSLQDRDGNKPLEDVNPTALAAGVSQGGLTIKDFHLEDDKYVVFGSRSHYRDQNEALERIGRNIASHLPDDVKTYHIVETTGNMPLVETVIDAEKFIKIANRDTIEDDLTTAYTRRSPDPDIMALEADREFSGFFWDYTTFWTQNFGAPESFYLFQLGLIFNGGYAFNDEFMVNSSVRVNLLDNYNDFNFRVDSFNSPVPRVRTYIREYVLKGDASVDTLYMHWKDQLSENLYAQAYGGYLELMYGGIGGELFYQEVDSNFGFGLDLNLVQQRSFDNDYQFRDYKAFTGHLSVYYQPDFIEDVQLTANIGQFLAKDIGVNFDFARRFDSGIVVGAYAAITDISSEDYGEGSFTKGFYISIPFDIFSLRPSRSRGRIPWVPIARDGGQPLQRPIRLFDVTNARSPFYN